MYKRLKLIVPIVQVLAVLVLLWAKHWESLTIYQTYVAPTERIIRAVNIPLVFAWYPILWLLEHASPYLSPEGGAPLILGIIVFGLILVLSIALFWYFVVTEIELRKQGKSLLKFPDWFRELAVAVGLFGFGIGAIVCAITDQQSRLWMHFGGINFGIALVILPPLILLVWAVVLIGISIHDFIGFLRIAAGPAKQ
ncbi:MAG TPA: hypothetical protein VN577_23490 [Terriglobales bacterium]|nr:hypothetical protein [Terriglobales bacterium]